MKTKPLPITHSDTIVLQALFDAAEGDAMFQEMADRLYAQLVTMQQEFEAESGVMQ